MAKIDILHVPYKGGAPIEGAYRLIHPTIDSHASTIAAPKVAADRPPGGKICSVLDLTQVHITYVGTRILAHPAG